MQEEELLERVSDRAVAALLVQMLARLRRVEEMVAALVAGAALEASGKRRASGK